MQHDLFIHLSGSHGYYINIYLHAGGTDIMVKGINRDEVNLHQDLVYHAQSQKTTGRFGFPFKSKVLMGENGLNFPRTVTVDDAISFYVDMCSFMHGI